MNKTVIGLVVLSVVPMLGGLMRLAGFMGFASPEGHERFAADPIPAVMHIVGATTFAMLGAFQFAPSLRRTRWHALAGRVLTLFGIVAALAGIWMVITWPAKPFDSALLNVLRVSVGAAIAFSLGLGIIRAREGDLASHTKWMTRGYALGASGGTQAITLMPFLFVDSLHNEGGNVLLMSVAWVINLAVAEWTLRSPALAVEAMS